MHEERTSDRLPADVPDLTDDQRKALEDARREIAAARRERERAQQREREATLRLARALAAAPRRIGGGRPPAGTLTVDELAELAGLESRQGVYNLIEKAEAEQ